MTILFVHKSVKMKYISSYTKGKTTMLNDPYYEITKTIDNLPVNIILHPISPIQIIEAHWHRALEISIVFEGEVIFYNANQVARCQKNDINLTNCEEIHYSIPQYKQFKNKNGGFTLQINYDFLCRFIPDIDRIYFEISDENIKQKLVKCMFEIYNYYSSNLHTKYIRIYATVLEMMAILYEECKKEKTIPSTKKTKEIIQYIHQHYQSNLLAKDVADHFGYSREYFSRFFKQEIGLSFKQYLTYYRLHKAIYLLKNTHKTNAEIASETGFSNELQLITSFKKRFLMTPGQYKKSHFQYKHVK